MQGLTGGAVKWNGIGNMLRIEEGFVAEEESHGGLPLPKNANRIDGRRRNPPEVERLFTEQFTWLDGGWVEPPTKPGLGVELDWEYLRAHEQVPYTNTFQGSLWHVDGSVADW